LIYSKRAYQEYHGGEDLKMHVQNKTLITAQKDGDFYEIGEPNKQGARNDLKKLAAEINC